jgi:mannitol-1-phosphate 5-dehydrogenase
MIATEKERIFLGFGLGAIQTGLFLYEAQSSGLFDRLVIAEVVPETVRRVRQNNGLVNINIAHPDHIESVQVGPVEIYHPGVEADRQALVDLVAAAREIATAVPGVSFYCNSSGPETISRILAAGLRAKARQGGPQAVIYTAENHNHAAEILQKHIMAEIPLAEQDSVKRLVCIVNTVIGKMSGVINDPSEMQALNLVPMMPGIERAFLVESFNRILISRIRFEEPGFQRGITSFIEKDDLLPFEEAKLFGHNATHALGGYLGALLGAKQVADLPAIEGMMAFLRRAFIEESGASLIHRYQGIDPLFTPAGYAEYADDLLKRMINPFLADQIERVSRDLDRKLGWDDRLAGTMRLGFAEGVRPARYALGAAAAVAALDPAYLHASKDPTEWLMALWKQSPSDPQVIAVLALIMEMLDRLRHWHTTHAGDPQELFKGL